MLDLVKINPSVTLELKSGQKVTIDLEEARQIIKGLTKFVEDGEFAKVPPPRIQRRKDRKNVEQTKIAHMSEAKRIAILTHLNNQLSAKPKTISKLLSGITYVPNHLPHIRKMIEGQHNVAKRRIGKRIFYYRG